MNNLANVQMTNMPTNGVLAVGRIKSLNEMRKQPTIQVHIDTTSTTEWYEIDPISNNFINKYLNKGGK